MAVGKHERHIMVVPTNELLERPGIRSSLILLPPESLEMLAPVDIGEER